MLRRIKQVASRLSNTSFCTSTKEDVIESKEDSIISTSIGKIAYLSLLMAIDVEMKRKRNSDIADYIGAVIAASQNSEVSQEDLDLAKTALLEAIERYCVE